MAHVAGSQDLDQMKDYNTVHQKPICKNCLYRALSKKYSLELGYQLAYNYGTNDQLTYSYSPVSKKYDICS